MTVDELKTWFSSPNNYKHYSDTQLESFAEIATMLQELYTDESLFNKALHAAINHCRGPVIEGYGVEHSVQSLLDAKRQFETMEARLTGEIMWLAKKDNKQIFEVVAELGLTDYFNARNSSDLLNIDEI